MLPAPRLVVMLARWIATMRGLIWSSRAISLCELPLARTPSTALSRPESNDSLSRALIVNRRALCTSIASLVIRSIVAAPGSAFKGRTR